MLLGPNLPHTWRSVRSSTRSATRSSARSPKVVTVGGHSAIVVQFILEHLGRELLAREEMQGLHQMFGRSQSGLYFGAAETKRKATRQLRQLLV